MTIRSVYAAGFKSLHASTSIDLGRVNVFIGANGSGKSNVLEAIGVLSAAAGGRVDAEALSRRGVRLGEPALMKTSFRNDRRPGDIRLGASTEQSAYDVGLFNPLDEPEPAWRYHTESLTIGDLRVVGRSHRSSETLNPAAGLAALTKVELDAASPGADLLDRLEGYRIYSPGTPFLRGVVPDVQSDPIGLSGGRLAEAVDELMASLSGDDGEELMEDLLSLIPWAQTFRAVPTGTSVLARGVPAPSVILEFVDRFMAEGANRLTAYDASEGAIYVLFAAVIALHARAPKLSAVDNLDQALNPRLAKRLVTFLCEATKVRAPDRQLLFTCHNPLVLDGLPLQEPDVRLFAVDRDAGGRSVVARIEVGPELLEKAKQGWTLSRLWVMGHLGGVPSV